MRILGLDIGEKRIGIALSDPLGFTAQGLETWYTRGEDADIAHIADLAKSREAVRIVSGLPRNMNGSEGPMAEKVRAFCSRLEAAAGIPVVFQDERMTTAQARRVLIGADVRRSKRKEVVDAMAASLILQSYLDAQRREAPQS